MERYIVGQKMKEMFTSNPFKGGDVFQKVEEEQSTYLEILVFLGRNFGRENTYAVKANISYLQEGQDFFTVKTETELQQMIEREKYEKILKKGC